MSKPLQHSPGPWTYSADEELIANSYCVVIADLVKSPHHGDGHLIAAAPDLLRLLRVLTGKGTHEEGEAAHDEAEALIARLDGCE